MFHNYNNIKIKTINSTEETTKSLLLYGEKNRFKHKILYNTRCKRTTLH